MPYATKKRNKRPQVRIDWRLNGGPWYVFGRAYTVDEARGRVKIIRLTAANKAGVLETRIAKYCKCRDGEYYWIIIFNEQECYVGDDETLAEVEHEEE